MKTVLLISSLVSSSQVGATASAFCLRRLGVDVIVLPTTLFGRHPGWGPPGGERVSAKTLSDMWTAIRAQNIKFDALMSGYMAAEDHIDLTIQIIKHLRNHNPDVKILIDPVKGDDGRLYIPESRAKAMGERLVPQADILTPNLYELSYLTGRPLETLPHIIDAARAIAQQVLVTSVPYKGQIGALWVTPDTIRYVGHESFERVPNGGGDCLAALFLAHRLRGQSVKDAQHMAVSAVFQILKAARANGHSELAITEHQNTLTHPTLLDIEDIYL